MIFYKKTHEYIKNIPHFKFGDECLNCKLLKSHNVGNVDLITFPIR